MMSLGKTYRFSRVAIAACAAVLLFAACPFAGQDPWPWEANGPWYKNTDGYKDGLIVWLKKGGTEETYEKEYLHRNWPDGNIPSSRLDHGLNNMARGVEAMGNLFQREFLIMLGFNPDQMTKDQLRKPEIEDLKFWKWKRPKMTIYEPVKGYDKLKPEYVKFYMTYMFKNTLDSIRGLEAAARANAQTAIRLCDENLKNRALADMRFVLKVYQERLAHAHDIDEMNEHQLNYFNSELDYLMNPLEDLRYVEGYILVRPFSAKYTLDRYLGVEVSRYDIAVKGLSVPEELLDELQKRRDAIRILGEKTAAVRDYLSTSIKTLEENIRQIETAFKKDACVQCR